MCDLVKIVIGEQELCETNYDFNLLSETDLWLRMWVQYLVEWLWKLGLWNAGSMYVIFLSINLLQSETFIFEGWNGKKPGGGHEFC